MTAPLVVRQRALPGPDRHVTTPFRFTERIVVLDSDKIDTLLAIPL